MDLKSGPASCPLSWTSAQRDCTERASAFPPRKAAAPLTAPLERLASKGPAETATIKPGGSPHNDNDHSARTRKLSIRKTTQVGLECIVLFVRIISLVIVATHDRTRYIVRLLVNE